MRHNGQRLPPDVIRQHGHIGWLVVTQFKFGPVLYARLFREPPPPGKDLAVLPYLLELSNVELGKLNRGILLKGMEPVSQTQWHRQAWWVLPKL